MGETDARFPPGGDEHDRRDSHTELWRAINLSREKAHSDAKIIGEIQYRVGMLEDWREAQEKEVLAHGKELSAISAHLGILARGEERREENERERQRRTLSVIALIMTAVGVGSSVIVTLLLKAFGAAPK